MDTKERDDDGQHIYETVFVGYEIYLFFNTMGLVKCIIHDRLVTYFYNLTSADLKDFVEFEMICLLFYLIVSCREGIERQCLVASFLLNNESCKPIDKHIHKYQCFDKCQCLHCFLPKSFCKTLLPLKKNSTSWTYLVCDLCKLQPSDTSVKFSSSSVAITSPDVVHNNTLPDAKTCATTTSTDISDSHIPFRFQQYAPLTCHLMSALQVFFLIFVCFLFLISFYRC